MLQSCIHFARKHRYACAVTILAIPVILMTLSTIAYLPFFKTIRYQTILMVMNLFLIYLLITCLMLLATIFIQGLRCFQRAALIAILTTCICAICTNTIGAYTYASDMTKRANAVANLQVRIGNTVYKTTVKEFFAETRRDHTPYLITDITPINDRIAEIKWSGYRDLSLYDQSLQNHGIDYDAMGVCPVK